MTLHLVVSVKVIDTSFPSLSDVGRLLPTNSRMVPPRGLRLAVGLTLEITNGVLIKVLLRFGIRPIVS